MNFREKLEEFKKSNLNLYELIVADEVDNYGFHNGEGEEITLSHTEFEIICKFVYNWCINSNATPNEVCDVLDILFRNDDYTIQDLIDNGTNPCYESVVERVNNYCNIL